MKSLKTLALAFLCVLSVCFFSCKDSSSVTSKDEDFGISITLPGSKERAVYYGFDEVDSYTINVSQNDKDVTSKNGAPGETVKIKLTTSGVYDISVIGYDSNSQEIAKGSANVTLALDDGYKYVPIDIKTYKKTIGIKASWETPDEKKYGAEDAISYDLSIYEGQVCKNTIKNVSILDIINIDIPSDSSNKVIIEAKNSYQKVIGSGEATFSIQKDKNVLITIVGKNKLCINLTSAWETSDEDEDKYKIEDAVRYDVSIYDFQDLVKTYENVTLKETLYVPSFFNNFTIRIEAKNSNQKVVGAGEAKFVLKEGETEKNISISIVGDFKWDSGYKGETITMGSWPQSLADVTGLTLIATGKTYDGKNAEYSDENGNKYVKVSNSYYKVEPITWRVIFYYPDGSKKLLADKIYTMLAYYGTYSGTRALDNKTIYPNNYKYSNIRAYLNSTKNQFETDGGTPSEYDVDWTNAGFLTTAFTSTELAKIKTVLVDNSAATTASNTNQYACENTEDKVYLLSYKEAQKKLYGLNNNSDRIMKTTAYARANGAYQSENEAYGGYWWQRSPNYYYDFGARYISVDGYNYYDYYLNRVVDINDVGVVPALTVTE